MPRRAPGWVRRATPRSLPEISTALSRAFFDDPVNEWVFPGSDRRRRIRPGFFSLFVEAFQPHGEIYIARAGETAGAALWTPAGVQPISDEEEFSRQLEHVVGADTSRIFEVLALLEEHHPHEACFHLAFLGVVPERQGQGIGSALMAPVLDRCDCDGLPAYLEASSARSKRRYERRGFQAVGQIAPTGGPPLWPMWRPPRPRS